MCPARCLALALAITSFTSSLCGCGDDADTPADAGDDKDGGSHHDAGPGLDAGPLADAGSNTDTGPHTETDAAAYADAGDDAGLPTVTLQFAAKVGDLDFACGQTYEGLGTVATTITPVDFRFFVQDIVLIASDGSKVPFEIATEPPYQLEGVALLDFTDGTGKCRGGAGKNGAVTGRAPKLDYVGVEFSNGVPDPLNHQNIALAEPPLQEADLYWGWASGYRFVLAELAPTANTGDDDAGSGPLASVIHVGAGGCAGSFSGGFTCSRPNRNRVLLEGFDPTQQAIVIDFARLFAQVDLERSLQCHGTGPGCEVFYDALGLNMQDGSALQTQQLFRAP